MVRSLAAGLAFFSIFDGVLLGQAQIGSPVLTTKAAQHGAVIVSLASPTPGAKVHYTVDGSAPTEKSPIYEAPFLVASNLTVKAVATAPDLKTSPLFSKRFQPNIKPGDLVWSDEFTNTTGAKKQPDPSMWGYDTGATGFGNHELEDYCAWGSTQDPCDSARPNAYVGIDGFLHIVARKATGNTGIGASIGNTPGDYTSARLSSQGLFSVQYGRLEVRAKVPEGQGYWPAFWTLGNNIATDGWPASGEQDILERVDSATAPDWNEGSIHGPGFTGDVGLGKKFFFPAGQTTAEWHTYGMIWKKNSVAYYIDDPAKPYVTYTNPASLTPFKDAVWPFDTGDSAFLLINLAVGGDWPKNPDASTNFPAELVIDYVRLYAN